jgi:hypothetical protein
MVIKDQETPELLDQEIESASVVELREGEALPESLWKVR